MRTVTICLVLVYIVAAKAQTTPVLQCPNKQLDVAIVVDDSETVVDDLFKKAQALTQRFADLYNINECGARFSIIQFSDEADKLLSLKKGDTRCSVEEGIFKLKREERGKKCTSCGLEEAQDQLKDRKRPVPRVVILYIDEEPPEDRVKVKKISKELRDDGVTILCVNLGTASITDPCEDVTDTDDEMFSVENPNAIARIQQKVCNLGAKV